MRGAEEGVHRALPVGRDEDQAAPGRRIAGARRGVVVDPAGVDIVREDFAELVLGDLADERAFRAERRRARRACSPPNRPKSRPPSPSPHRVRSPARCRSAPCRRAPARVPRSGHPRRAPSHRRSHCRSRLRRSWGWLDGDPSRDFCSCPPSRAAGGVDLPRAARNRKHRWDGSLPILLLCAPLALAGCGGEKPRMASAPLPARRVAPAAGEDRNDLPPVPEPEVMHLPGLDSVIGANALHPAQEFGEPRISLAEGDARKLQFSGRALRARHLPLPARTAAATRSRPMSRRGKRWAGCRPGGLRAGAEEELVEFERGSGATCERLRPARRFSHLRALPGRRRSARRISRRPVRQNRSGFSDREASPQPQAPLAFGFSNMKPAAKSSSTQSIVEPTR